MIIKKFKRLKPHGIRRNAQNACPRNRFTFITGAVYLANGNTKADQSIAKKIPPVLQKVLNVYDA
jgi:hypothetical protein